MNLTDFLAFSVKNGASDLHISAGMTPLVRIDGKIKRINVDPLSAEDTRNMLYDVMNDHQRKKFEQELEVDFSMSIADLARFRINVFNQQRGPAGVFRTIPSVTQSLEELNAPAIFKTVSLKPKGLILVTGPTGSGKSTTLSAMVDLINEQRYGHILTIEDPIEFVHTPKNCIINQREIEKDTHSFSAALRSAMREDPDIILVGEMRDLETIRLALTAAETGHLVLATLHTTSAAKSVNRIIDAFPGNEKDLIRSMLSESLEAVISQLLLPRQGGGRVAVWEVMLGTSAIRNLIRSDKVPQMYSVIQTGQSLGMQTMDQCLIEYVQRRQITVEAAIEHAIDPSKLEEAANSGSGLRASG